MAELFAGCGKAPGVKTWAINNFKLQTLPEDHNGTFYSGDSYLILHTKSDKGALRHNIHFWQGQDSSSDEQGAVAVYAAQLDEFLGGGPVQYRQTQGAEDDEFKKLFPKVVYRLGGCFVSGFQSAAAAVDPKSPTKLHHIKSPSRTFIQVVEVPPNVSSLNSGDSFVLDVPALRRLFLWHGSASNIRERMRALDVANSLRVNNTVKFTVVDDGDVASADAQAFFQALGASDPASVSIPAPVPDDVAIAGAGAGAAPRLFSVSADSDPKEVSGQLSKAQLDSEGQYCLVAAGSAWVWTGARAKAGASFGLGSAVLQQLGLPASSAIRCIKEDYEPALFTSYFPDWAHEQYLRARAAASAAAAAPAQKPEQLDAAAVAAGMLQTASSMAAEPDAEHHRLAAALAKYGTDGSLEVFVVRGSALEQLPEGEQGDLYSSDSYVVDYAYSDGSGQRRHVVYTWLGRQSTSSEQGTAALLATDKHHGYQGCSTLARVAQGQEPPHFVLIFAKHGGLVIHRGNRPAAGGAAVAAEGAARLYQVKAEAALGGPYAVEVDALHSSLNSGDCFVLLPVAGAELFLWNGKLSSAAEQQVAAAAAARLGAAFDKGVSTLQEGTETAAFWDAIGGQGPYPQYDATQVPTGQPVLFHFRDTGGPAGIQVEPYAAFSQEELCADDVAMLDSGRELFLWYGNGCTAVERSRAKDIAGQYAAQLEQQHGGRRAGVQASMIEVESGQEPPFFTQHFPGWDARPRPTVADVYAEKLEKLKELSMQD